MPAHTYPNKEHPKICLQIPRISLLVLCHHWRISATAAPPCRSSNPKKLPSDMVRNNTLNAIIQKAPISSKEIRPNFSSRVLPSWPDGSGNVTHSGKEQVPDNPKGSNPKNPKDKDPKNPNVKVPQNSKKQVHQNQKKQDNGKTPGKRQISPDIQKDIDEADHFIYDHPHEVTSGQNTSDDQHTIDVVPIQTIILDPKTPTVVQMSTPVACDPPNPVFVVCNFNTSVCRDFDVDEYRQVHSEDDIISDSEDEPINTTDDAHALQLIHSFGATTS
ncbi:hypothetical protein HAX54_008873 [Datura stramonium]|uniref:Uncharacterized protein n=1 Tax=Datura stramonium TaxID=4076 RepID=A0ABS8TEZ8_DATST|nr:hypothetical protein [Datura stramonium]